MTNTKQNDWVRFYRNGTLVIGVVQYLGEKDVLGYRTISTDAGTVSQDMILEVRTNEYSQLPNPPPFPTVNN